MRDRDRDRERDREREGHEIFKEILNKNSKNYILLSKKMFFKCKCSKS
jgi:hypothetical protein